MDTYDKVTYSSITGLLVLMIIFFTLLIYWKHQENMFELELKYKSLERNETNNDNKSVERNKTIND